MIFILIPLFSLLLLMGSCSGQDLSVQESDVSTIQHEQIINSNEMKELEEFIGKEYGDTSKLIDLLGEKILEMSPEHFAEFNRETFEDSVEVIEMIVADYEKKKSQGEDPSLIEILRTYYPKLQELHTETSESFSEKFKEFERELNRNEYWDDETQSNSIEEKYVDDLVE